MGTPHPFIVGSTRRLKLHWVLNVIGLSLAAVGFALSYMAVEDESGGRGGHLAVTHSYYGAGALLLGFYQPLNAFLRPTNASPADAAGKSTPRLRWEWVHRASAAFGLCLSVVAVTSGTQSAAAWGAVRGGDAAYKAYVGWVVAVVAATCVMEVVRWRERRGAAGAWGGSRSRDFVALTELSNNAEVEDFT